MFRYFDANMKCNMNCVYFVCSEKVVINKFTEFVLDKRKGRNVQRVLKTNTCTSDDIFCR